MIIHKPIDLSNAYGRQNITRSDLITINFSLLVCGVLSADKTLFVSMRCFSRILISNVHKSIIVMNSIDTRFSRPVFEAV